MNTKYITLKEAAKISGYAPDYIGQLIRTGKLSGKQVYRAVAWMTTEDALRQYMHKNNSGKNKLSRTEKIIIRWQEFRARIMLEIKFARLLTAFLYLVIIFSVGFSLILFYIISVRIDSKLNENARQRLENRLE